MRLVVPDEIPKQSLRDTELRVGIDVRSIAIVDLRAP